MNHTPQIEKAIRFAARKHHGQFRAESDPLPYITHLFSTALLVAEDGAEDDGAVLRRMGGDPGRYLWFHGELAALASERLPEHRLTRRLLEAHGRECEDLANI